jgi:fructose-bisphosphate aldolase class 1
MGIIKDTIDKVDEIVNPQPEVSSEEVAVEETPAEVSETPAEEEIEPIIEPEVSVESEMTEAQITAGQTLEEAREWPVEGAQIHNK